MAQYALHHISGSCLFDENAKGYNDWSPDKYHYVFRIGRDGKLTVSEGREICRAQPPCHYSTILEVDDGIPLPPFLVNIVQNILAMKRHGSTYSYHWKNIAEIIKILKNEYSSHHLAELKDTHIKTQEHMDEIEKLKQEAVVLNQQIQQQQAAMEENAILKSRIKYLERLLD